MYNPSIPNANDLLSVSQGQLKDNFTSANTTFGIDHYTFNDVTANIGFHKQVTLPLINAASVPASVGQIALLGTNLVALNPSQVWYKRDGVANTVPINGILDPLTPASNLSSGYTFLIGNVLLQWGSVSANGAGVWSATFPRKFTFIYQAVVSSNAPAVAANISGIGITAINGNAANSATVRWIAIGLKTDTL